jgi:hypothetical protein
VDLAAAINPNIEIAQARPRKAAVVCVGETRIRGKAIYVGSDYWIGSVGTAAPIGSRDSGNPFGAGAAACLGAANLFRVYFGDLLEHGGLDPNARVSLLNFATGDKAANEYGRVPVSLGLVQLAGVGAIGNAAVWALAMAQDVEGRLDLIDPETLDLSNLQRYVLVERKDVTAIKANVASSFLTGRSRITPNPVQKSWSDFVIARGHHRFDLVATALDTARDRVEVQGSLPKTIVNAWTQPGDVGVSRHAFLGENACLACLYLPTGKSRNQDEIIADELRMPEAVLAIRTMLESGQPVGTEFVTEVARRATVDPETLLPFATLPLTSFRAKAVCGQALLAEPDSDRTAIQVPMAFQSAMAGVMLAAEIVVQRASLRDAPLPTKSAIDLLRPVPGRLNVPVAKVVDGAARCICSDPDFTRAYTAKYASSSKQPPSLTT